MSGARFTGEMTSLRCSPRILPLHFKKWKDIAKAGVSAFVAAFCLLGSPMSAEAQTYSTTEKIEYHDDLSLWVIGQVKKVTCAAPAECTASSASGTVMSQVEHGWKALPWKTYSFGKLQQTLSYDSTSSVASGQLGTVKGVADGNGNVTTLSGWMRGTPQTIKYPITSESPSGATEFAVVNSNGWITSVTDENLFVTNYGYDAMGRLTGITYPTGDAVAWLPTNLVFEPVTVAEYGLPAGHWRQTVTTGNAKKLTYFDAMWRPVVTREYDATNATTISNTQRFQRFAYDESGRVSFASYPGITDALTTGTWTLYDPLSRVTSVSQDSELGLLTTTTEYLAGFKTRVTPPKGMANPAAWQTTTSYMAYDQPVMDWPVGITHPEGANTTIARDVFGKPISLKRHNAGSTVALTRNYVYDGFQQLCLSVEPETAATVMDYDGAGNLLWSAGGQAFTASTACGTARAAAVNKVSRTYDARNRIKTLAFPDGRGNQTWNYHADGLPYQVYTYNGLDSTQGVLNTYTYNKRRLLTAETSGQIGWYTWSLGYGYDANGNLSAQSSYPDGLTITYSPNALGQPTLLKDQHNQIYAQDVSYYPNGALKQFTYGNGLTHVMWQTANRPMPDRSFDCIFVSGACQANTKKLDLSYDYDANGNVSDITDSKDGIQTRHMTYDALDRLTQTTSNMFGTAEYAYDVLDNLTRVKANGRDHTYIYDSKWQLGLVRDTGTPDSVIGFGYDEQGNVENKQGVEYDFDYGNRLRSVEDRESEYRYDAYGRRVHSKGTWYAAWQYNHAGQLMYAQDGRHNRATNYVYLGSSLLAMREKPMSGGNAVIKYQHTDALGSPIAVTDATKEIVETSQYEPYGKLVNRAETDGPAFTGHVQDAGTGLTYMQQRYYDPGIGRFLSVDPVVADSATGANFNRYWYANNNPYKFKDPDGRWIEDVVVGIPSLIVGGKSLHDNIKAGNVGSAIVDGVGMVLDGAAIGIPLLPGGAGLAIKGARAADNAIDVANGADNIADGVKLNKQLGSEQQLGEVMSGKGEVIAGGSSGDELRAASGLAESYGGKASDWTKVTSSSHTTPNGEKFSTHAYQNQATGLVVEPKTKIVEEGQ